MPPADAAAEADAVWRVVPAPWCPQVGDRVFVSLRSDKDTGSAVVLQPPEAFAGTQHEGRCLVQYDTAGPCHVRLERLAPVFPRPGPSCTALVCETTDEHRRLARSQVTRGDHVVEIGASYGACTAVLSQHARSVLGLEISAALVDEARRRHPGLRFEQLDALTAPGRLAELAAGATALFVDIGGNRVLEALVRLLPWLVRVLRPRLLVVKSEELHSAAIQWMAQQQVAASASSCGAAAAPQAQPARGAPPGAPPLAGAGIIPDSPGWWEHLHRACAVPALGGASGPLPGAVPNWYAAGAAGGWARNPLRFPQRFNAAGLQICRPHNYQTCHKGDACPFDHGRCHFCGQAGHLGRECPTAAAAAAAAPDVQAGAGGPGALAAGAQEEREPG